MRTSHGLRCLSTIFLFAVIISCSSCARVIFGMGKNKPLSNTTVEKYARRYGLPSSRILDSNYYHAIRSFSADKDITKSLKQPLQFWLYQDDTLVFSMVNCYAYYKFPNLVWPLDNVSSATSPMKVHLNYHDHLKLLGDERNSSTAPELIVVWSKFLGRQDRHFLRKVHRYLKSNPSVKATFYNGDNMYNGKG